MQRGSTVNFHFHMKRRLPLLILGGQSTVNTERINSQLSLLHGKAVTSVDPGGLMINMERINSQLSFSHGKAIASGDPWGGGVINSPCREGQQSTCTFARKGYHLC